MCRCRASPPLPGGRGRVRGHPLPEEGHGPAPAETARAGTVGPRPRPPRGRAWEWRSYARRRPWPTGGWGGNRLPRGGGGRERRLGLCGGVPGGSGTRRGRGRGPAQRGGEPAVLRACPGRARGPWVRGARRGGRAGSRVPVRPPSADTAGGGGGDPRAGPGPQVSGGRCPPGSPGWPGGGGEPPAPQGAGAALLLALQLLARLLMRCCGLGARRVARSRPSWGFRSTWESLGAGKEGSSLVGPRHLPRG